MGKAPSRSDQGEAFDIAVDLPDPFGGAYRAARDRRAPDAVACKVLVEAVCGMAALEDREPKAEIVVALVLHRDGSGDRAVDPRGQRRDRGVLQELAIGERGRYLDQAAGDRVAFVDAAEGGVAEGGPLLAGEGELALELPRQPQIVAVEESEIAALRGINRGVAGERRAAILGLSDQLDAGIALADRGDDRRRPVGRAVVGDQEF